MDKGVPPVLFYGSQASRGVNQMWAGRAIGVAEGGQLPERMPCMALSAAAESWLLLLSHPLAFSCCRESHTKGSAPPIA